MSLQICAFSCSDWTVESGDARACNYGDPGVIGIGDDFEQLFDPAAPNGRHDTELGKMCSD